MINRINSSSFIRQKRSPVISARSTPEPEKKSEPPEKTKSYTGKELNEGRTSPSFKIRFEGTGYGPTDEDRRNERNGNSTKY